MLSLSKKMFYHVLTLTFIVTAGLMIWLRVEFMMQHATQKAESCLLKAVDLYRERFFSNNQGPITYVYSSKDKAVTLDIDGQNVRLPEEAHSDPENAIKMAQHTVLHNRQSIDPVRLDSLFKSELLNEGFPSNVSVSTFYNQANGSGNRPDGQHAALTLNVRPPLLGVLNEISVYADLRIRLLTFCSWLLTDHVALFILSSCMAGIASLYFFSISDYSAPVLTESGSQCALSYQYADIILNMEDHSVYIGSEQIDTSPRNFTLLLMFLANKDHFVSRAEIIDAFWSSKIDCSDRINTTVNRLRAYLKKIDHHVNIVTEDAGYRLVNTAEISYEQKELSRRSPSS